MYPCTELKPQGLGLRSVPKESKRQDRSPQRRSGSPYARALVGALILVLWPPIRPGHGNPAASETGPVDDGVNSNRAKPPVAFDYVIGPDDLLEIDVMDVAQLSRPCRVSPTGTIVVQLLPEPIEAAGLTPLLLSRVIEERLKAAGLVTYPHVTVGVKESRSHSIAVGGAVKRPQIYPVFGRITMMDLLSQAEGLSDDAGSKAVIARGDLALKVLADQRASEGGGVVTDADRTARVDLRKLLEAADSTQNISLYPGDSVTVQRAGIVYVVGAVNRPGGFPMKSEDEEITVLNALALAEDVAPTASKSRATIIRKNPTSPEGRQRIKVDLNKVLAGRAADLHLQASDILYVPDSSAKRVLRRSGEAAVSITTGLIIWRR